MEYQTVVSFTQTAALIFFVLMFVVVLAYTFWPGNKRRFERAARLPLDHNEEPAANRRRGQ